MEIPVIGFIPPINGIDGDFNTFRMGRRLGKLPEGIEVFLMDEKRKVVIGKAKVLSVAVGSLDELCVLYGAHNHTEIGRGSENPAQSLYRTIVRIYGPHLVNPKKIFTVISLRRIE